jgi:hypothetical protein
LIGRYYVAGFEGWKNWSIAEYGALWGGEPAAAMLTEYLRPGEMTLYAEKMPSLLAARQKFMKEAGQRHTAAVEVRRRFWHFLSDPEHSNIAPPLLVYADLLATGDARCIETAKMIYEAYVDRLDEVVKGKKWLLKLLYPDILPILFPRSIKTVLSG